MVLGTNKYSLD